MGTTPAGRPKKSLKKRLEPFIFLAIFFALFGYLGSKMGLSNMLKTMMGTAYDLLISTCLSIMSITVLSGALARLLTEFGVVALLEKILRPLMRPLFNLPGVAALGAVVTFLSDNPAIISLAKDSRFARFFKTYQMISLTNFGTAFGMGLVVIVTMMSYGYVGPAMIGLFGAACGCLVSTRLMQRFTLKAHPEYDTPATASLAEGDDSIEEEVEAPAEKSTFLRVLNSMLDGGRSGVDLGFAIIPGVLIISTFVMMLTFDTMAGEHPEFTGAAYEGVGLLPHLADKVDFIFRWCFGFTNSQLIAFPITALGAVGAALGLVPTFIKNGLLDGNAVAVFTAIGMCWSGYLSTHTAMLDTMGFRSLTSKAILAHTIGGLCAGIVAHWAYVLATMF